MSLDTGRRRSTSNQGLDRLPRPAATANRGREIRLGLLGVIGLVLLVVGIPAALIYFVGYPLPRSAPSRDWLTQTVTATLIIKILACVVWLVWAHFVVCILSEWRALRRGRLPANVPLGGGSQLLARRLVAAALLLAGAATAFGGVSSTVHSAPAATRQVVTATQGARAGVPASVPVSTTATTGAAATTAAPDSTRATDSARGAKYYVVQPSTGRNYDCLWDIAQRTLGDPMRYKEIFELNKDRVQADGSRLVDANLIRPGWELRLPADASGPGVETVHASAPARAVTPPAAPSVGARPAATGAVGSITAPTSTAATSTAATASTARSGSSLDSTVFGGTLMLAGIVLALTARRGPYGDPAADEEALATIADLGLAESLDRALRNLAAARKKQARDLPHPVIAWASSDEVTLNLAGGDVVDPPTPWSVSDDGRSWTCPLAQVVDRGDLAQTAAPFPGLISVGRHDDYELFVDFEQAPGLVSIGGEVELGRELATGIAIQAVTSAWSDGAQATLVGFADGADLAQIDPKSIAAVGRLDAVLDQLERENERVHRLQQELGVDGVLSGRQSRRSSSWRPHLIVLSGPPTSDEAQRLQRLVGAGRSKFIVLVVGDIQTARWRFVLDASGRLDLGVLGGSAQAHRLTRASIPKLVELLEGAARRRQEQSSAVTAMTPHQAVAPAAAPAGDVNALAGNSPVPRPSCNEPTVTVSLLGPVTIAAPGPIDEAKRDLATEIAVALALHPQGISDAVLRASIWPRGVSETLCEAAMSEVVAWLGIGRDGLPCVTCVNGDWLLGDSVRVDWDELRRHAASAAGPNELSSLLLGVELFGGRAFSATLPGRYAWLSFARAAREARIVGTAVTRRAAALLVAQQREDEAGAVLRRGLELVPAAEAVWRDLLRLVSAREPAAAAGVAEQMYATLRGLRVWPEPETDALVEQLAPGHANDRTA